MVAMIMRLFSYLYHLVLALFLLGISGIVLTSGSNNLRLGMLPWTGDQLLNWVFWGSLIGLTVVLLAVTGKFRYLFPIWALIVLVMMIRGYLIGPYVFSGSSDFSWTLLLIFGALLAFLGSLTVFRMRARRV
jgi:hypothetical protein